MNRYSAEEDKVVDVFVVVVVIVVIDSVLLSMFVWSLFFREVFLSH